MKSGPDERSKMLEDRKKRLGERMALIKHKIIVLSGKGGVGKSTVAAYLATALASRGKAVGLLDTDIHGPSIPKMLGVEEARISVVGNTVIPVRVHENLRVMSIAFLLRSKADAVIWRGPLKMGMIEEFLANVEWGPLDYLIIDSPPGTGDEPLSICQLVPGLDGALVVATPQEIALADVEKSITFCRQLHTRVVGVIENMSGFVCPHCGKPVDVFKTGGAERLASKMGVPFLGRIPIQPEVVDICDSGRCSVENLASDALRVPFDEITTKIIALEGAAHPVPTGGDKMVERQADEKVGVGRADVHDSQPARHMSESVMRIALPLDGDRLSTHFGHSARFAVYDVKGAQVVAETFLTPPPHAPGAIPSWLKDQDVDVVIASGLGRRAMAAFDAARITVVSGAPSKAPRDVVAAYLSGTLAVGENVCDH